VFKKGGRLAKREQWKYGNDNLKVVNDFSNVGVYFTNRLCFYKMAENKSIMSDKAKKCFSFNDLLSGIVTLSTSTTF
jgi:hypothetical protein